MGRRVLGALLAVALVAGGIASGYRSRPVEVGGTHPFYGARYHPWPGPLLSGYVGAEGMPRAAWPSRQVVLYDRSGNRASLSVPCEPERVEQTYWAGQGRLEVVARYGRPGCPGADTLRFNPPL